MEQEHTQDSEELVGAEMEHGEIVLQPLLL
jgi:hypothetical protein